MDRQRFSLDNDWRFHRGEIDIFKNIVDHGTIYSSVKAGGGKGPTTISYNDNNWETVNVPHDWCADTDFDKNAHPNAGFKSRGIGWYRKRFFIDKSNECKQVILEFDGISTDSIIYFNGSIVERNFSGYNSFVVDVSDRVLFGDTPNTLTIKVDATHFEGWWYEGAGIYRHTWLTIKEPAHIENWGVWVNPLKLVQDTWKTQIETTVENIDYEEKNVKLVSKIVDCDGNTVAENEADSRIIADGKTVISQDIEVKNPKLWDIDTPNLYKVISLLYIDSVLVDTDKTSFGYRTIAFCKDTGFYLNGKNVKLKGTCNHQDHACVGVALPDSIHEWRIRRLKEMGSNAYRCAHNTPAREILNACDKFGMLVMDENRNFETRPEVIKQVESMVKRDRNHPCVIMYSVFNEEPLQGAPEGRKMVKRLKSTIKRLDKTRPIVGALNGGALQDGGTSEALEIMGINYQLSVLDSFHEKYPDVPVVASESASAFSSRGEYKTDMEKQVFNSYDEGKAPWGATARENWKKVNSLDHVMGTFVWTGFDYMGEPTPFLWPSISTLFGIMDLCGFPKDAYYLYQAFWLNEPVLHIVPHWNFEDKIGETIKVMTHTNCEEVELILNGKSLGKKKIDIYEQEFWEVTYEPGELVAKGFNDGILVKEFKIETTTKAIKLVIEPDRDCIYGDGKDAIVVNIKAVDDMGRFVSTTNDFVEFTVDGLAKLLGVANGNANCHQKYASTGVNLYNGRCQIIVQSKVGAGELNVCVNSIELESAKATVKVLEKEPIPAIGNIHEFFVTNWKMSPITQEKPNPNVKLGHADMNSFEPVGVEYGLQSNFQGQLGKFALYRAEFSPEGFDAKKLFFYNISGEAEIYLNDKLIHSCENGGWSGKNVEIPLTKDMICKDNVLSVCVKSINKYTGIGGAVILKTN